MLPPNSMEQQAPEGSKRCSVGQHHVLFLSNRTATAFGCIEERSRLQAFGSRGNGSGYSHLCIGNIRIGQRGVEIQDSTWQ